MLPYTEVYSEHSRKIPSTLQESSTQVESRYRGKFGTQLMCYFKGQRVKVSLTSAGMGTIIVKPLQWLQTLEWYTLYNSAAAHA